MSYTNVDTLKFNGTTISDVYYNGTLVHSNWQCGYICTLAGSCYGIFYCQWYNPYPHICVTCGFVRYGSSVCISPARPFVCNIHLPFFILCVYSICPFCQCSGPCVLPINRYASSANEMVTANFNTHLVSCCTGSRTGNTGCWRVKIGFCVYSVHYPVYYPVECWTTTTASIHTCQGCSSIYALVPSCCCCPSRVYNCIRCIYICNA